MSDPELCSVLPWDTEFFGVSIARLHPERLDAGQLTEAVAWADARGTRCLYWLADPADPDGLARAQRLGFRWVDSRVTLEADLSASPCETAADIGPASSTETADLESIAAASHDRARFHSDGRFDRERCNALYATWIRKECAGAAKTVLAARAEGAVAGYVSCRQTAPDLGQIGLIAVASHARGGGRGRRLVRAANAYFLSRGLERAEVVTQGANVEALRTFHAGGYRVASVRLWLHRWSDEAADQRM